MGVYYLYCTISKLIGKSVVLIWNIMYILKYGFF